MAIVKLPSLVLFRQSRREDTRLTRSVGAQSPNPAGNYSVPPQGFDPHSPSLLHHGCAYASQVAISTVSQAFVYNLDFVDAMGHAQMTPVQAATIPPFMQHKDVVVDAENARLRRPNSGEADPGEREARSKPNRCAHKQSHQVCTRCMRKENESNVPFHNLESFPPRYTP